MARKFLTAVLTFILMLLVPLRPLAHESPVDHVDRGIRIWIDGEKIFLRYEVQLSERAAMMQLKKLDLDSDGEISERERESFFSAFAEKLAPQLRLQLDEKLLGLKPSGGVKLQPQFRQVFLFAAELGSLRSGAHAGELRDEYSRNYPGVYRWDGGKELERSGPRVRVTEAPKSYETSGHAAVLMIKFDVLVP